MAQVAELKVILDELGVRLDGAVEITADAEAVVTRLLKRAEIEGRVDDNEDVIRHRLEVYAEQTAPVSAEYEADGALVRVDGLGDVDEVTARLVAAIESILA